MDITTVLSALVSIVGVLVLLLYRGNDRRLSILEGTYETKEIANGHRTSLKDDLFGHAERDEQQFEALQVSLREFRTEAREQVASMRNEANEKRIEMRNDLINYRTETNNQLSKLTDMIQSQTHRRTR